MKKNITLLAAAVALCAIGASAQGYYYNPDLKASSLADIGFTTLDSNEDGKTWTPTTTAISTSNLDGEKVPYISKTPITIESGDHDDWLFTQAIYLEAGKTYKACLTFYKNYFAAIQDVFEVKLGTMKRPSAMTKTLVALEDGDMPQVSGGGLWTYNIVIKVDEEGDYYIGFHAIGNISMKLGVADIQIENGVGAQTPDAVTDLTITPESAGAKKAKISFTAPSVAKDGSALTALKKIELRRDSELIYTFDTPTPGEKLTYDDILAVSGNYTYTVIAYTEEGAGEPASATTFIGVNTPAAAASVKAVNTSATTATITWEAPVKDKDGYPIDAKLLFYDLYRTPLYSSEKTLVAEGLKECTYNDALTEYEGQQFYNYSVTVYTAEGEAAPAVANPIPMGTPYNAPYFESFAGGRASTIVTSTVISGNNYWNRTTDFEDVSSADGDNGMYYLTGGIGGAAAFCTGLIDLGSMPAPTLNYYTYNITGCDPKDHTLQVSVLATDGTRKDFEEYTPAMGWNKTILELTEFVGKTIRVIFSGYRNNNTEIHLDAIAISNIYGHDLSAAGIHVPAKVKTSEPFTVTVDVLNFGCEVSGDYSVELYCDGTKVDTYNGTALAVGAYDHVGFERTHGILSADEAEYTALVVYAKDQDTSNNSTETVSTTIRKNAYPTVQDLTGVYADGKVILSWGEPDTEKAQPYETFDNFESYQSWATSGVGDWTFVDKDEALIAGFSSTEGPLEMPGIPAYSKQSWWVFDSSADDFNNGSFATISGTKFLASMISGFNTDGIHTPGPVQNDDWAISPELYGGPQTIIINARSYSLQETAFETFEVLYSTGSLNPDDFVSVATYKDIPAEYKAYEVDLPDGAKYFAIRNISYNKLMLMIDDVTYVPVGDPAAFSINGYNVYRDGVQINTEPVEENEFEDAEAGNAEHTYHVSVLYSAGESQLSNAFNAYETGVEAITAEGAEVQYFNLQGLRVAAPSAGGVYIRRQGNTTTKVVK